MSFSTRNKMQVQNSNQAPSYYSSKSPINPDPNPRTVDEAPRFTYGMMTDAMRLEKSAKINNYMNEMNIINEIFTKSSTPYTDPAGNRIINATEQNIWFRNNVAFIFSIGSIFSESDQNKLSEILQLFQQTDETGKMMNARTDNDSFLLNAYKVLNYRDDFVKSLEQRMEIGNGNYHICLIPIVTTEDKEQLSIAPEECYRFNGPVDKYCEWHAVFDYMSCVVAKYGLLTDFVVMNADATGTFQIPTSDNIVRTQTIDSQYHANYRPDNDPNVLETRLLNKGVRYDELKVLNDNGWNLEQNFHQLVHDQVGGRRGGSMNVHINRDGSAVEMNHIRNNAAATGGKLSLQSRLHKENEKNRKELFEKVNQVDKKLGVETRFNLNNNAIVGAEQYKEYQIYAQNDTYDANTGRNVMFNLDTESKQTVPTIRVKRSVKRRKVNTNIPRQNHIKAPASNIFTGAVVYNK